ncbi:MAG: TusE/DsrC/DsvC family sulfur relay protein [Ferrovum sp.]|nr:TusE/DsrC/DsvC family sulfur relay protein [Ferrovum sp.]
MTDFFQPTSPLPPLDEEGYLVEPADWNEGIAHWLAHQEHIDLTPEHWTALHFMREYYAHHQVSADVRHVIRHLTEVHGADRNAIFRLFPYGYVKQACKIAGMKRPRAWSTG